MATQQLSPERLALLAKFNCTPRMDGKVPGARIYETKGVFPKRDKCGEHSTRIMDKARTLSQFTWKGLTEEAQCSEAQAKNAISRMLARSELVSGELMPGLNGLRIYHTKNTVKV